MTFRSDMRDRRWTMRALGTGALLVVQLSPVRTARADSTSDATALHQFDDGRAAFEKGQYAQALAAFSASLLAVPSPNTRLYIARCHRALGRMGSAFTSYRLASREAADRLNATGEKRYAATRDAAATEASEIERMVPHLTIAVPPDAADAVSVTLDDVQVPRSAWGTSMDVDAGAHTISATGTRRAPFSARITLADGEQKRIDVVAARLPTATITLALNPKPSGMAFEMDGRPADPTELEKPHDVDPGEHRVVIRAPGYLDFTWQQTLKDGDSRRVDVALQPDPTVSGGGTPKWLFYGVAAGAVITLGVASYFAIDATSRASNEKAKDPLTRDPGEQDRIRSEATTANVLFVGGAAIMAGAGVLAFTTNWKGGVPRTTGARAMPWFGPHGAGLSASGSF